MLARLSKTLPTNVAIGGLSLLVLGAGGTGATLSAGKSPVPTPNTHVTTADEAEQDEAEDADEASEGVRPTDTHGYCVSQVAKAETTGDANHGALVSAAAHACGKEAREAKAAARSAKAEEKAADRAAARQDGTRGKAYGHGHGTGRPAGVTPGAAAQR